MEEKKQTIFAKGIYFKKRRESAPDFIKAHQSIHIDNAIAFLQANKEHANKGYLNLDLTENEKDGEKFFSWRVNTWKPKDSVDEINKQDPFNKKEDLDDSIGGSNPFNSDTPPF